MNYGLIESDVVARAIVADAEYISGQPGVWIELPYGVTEGWNYVDGVFTDADGNPPPAEPAPKVKYRTLLTGPEWVELFTQDEWQWLKTRRNDGTNAGDRLDQMMDSIRWLDAVNVASDGITEFYDWMLAQGIPGGQTRIDELRQGIPI